VVAVEYQRERERGRECEDDNNIVLVSAK